MNKIMINRIMISLLIGLVFGAVLSEVTFSFLKETARAPQEIVLTIPAGTAEQVARGEKPPNIPTDMIFVVGDTLVVKNEDTADHQLGPLWIPAGSSATLALGNTESLAYECSFQPSKYVNFDVREPLTFGTRIYGIVFAGLPLGVLIALYSIILPTKKKESK
jgi:hypothetical protein